MSDIVERLATARNMMELERAAADAIDEIERLRAADALMVEQFESQESEITMLRGLLREWLQAAEIAQDLTFAPVAKATDRALDE